VQEIGTVAINQLNIKMFIFYDEGYASIRMTQRNYFKGRYLGCDTKTGLGLPNYKALFTCYGVPCMDIRPGDLDSAAFKDALSAAGPCAFIVHIDPEQTYFPKITSRVLENGSMESNPLHKMTPDLQEDLWKEVSVYLS
jgi:acetolactate synthase-1/2/3 large subunit